RVGPDLRAGRRTYGRAEEARSEIGPYLRASDSVRHRVEEDVDGHRVGHLLGEAFEVSRILAFTLPAVAEVGVVADDDHQPPAVIEDALVVHLAGVFAFVRV